MAQFTILELVFGVVVLLFFELSFAHFLSAPSGRYWCWELYNVNAQLSAVDQRVSNIQIPIYMQIVLFVGPI